MRAVWLAKSELLSYVASLLNPRKTLLPPSRRYHNDNQTTSPSIGFRNPLILCQDDDAANDFVGFPRVISYPIRIDGRIDRTSQH